MHDISLKLWTTLYATECSDLHGEGELGEIEKIKRRIMGKILGLKRQDVNTYRVKHNDEIFKYIEKKHFNNDLLQWSIVEVFTLVLD